MKNLIVERTIIALVVVAIVAGVCFVNHSSSAYAVSSQATQAQSSYTQGQKAAKSDINNFIHQYCQPYTVVYTNIGKHNGFIECKDAYGNDQTIASMEWNNTPFGQGYDSVFWNVFNYVRPHCDYRHWYVRFTSSLDSTKQLHVHCSDY